MERRLSVLLVGSDEPGFDAAMEVFEQGGFRVQSDRVDSLESCAAGLTESTWDVILWDFDRADPGSIETLRELIVSAESAPLIVVSGATSEEEAVQLMGAGVHCMIRKERLRLLPQAVERCLEQVIQLREHAATIRRLELLAHAVEQAAESVVITDARGDIEYVNPGFERMTGYSQDEVLGANPRILKSGQQPDEFYEALWSTLVGGKAWTGTFINRRKDGEIYQEHGTISPIRDKSGEISHYLGVRSDVTVQHRLEDQLKQSQRLEAVGTLAGGVAHDFNNLVTVITGTADLLLQRLEPGSEIHDEIGTILSAGNRAALLTSQLLAFSRKQFLRPTVVNLNELLVSLQQMLARLAGEDVKFELKVTDSLWSTRVDESQFGQILVNLVANARDAMPQGGRLLLETANVTHDALYAACHRGVEPGDYVMLAVTDTGVGMSQPVVDRIFEPFFTTKDQGKGTGLGLSMIYGIVKQSGGNIWVYSEGDVGTTFKIYLPRADAEEGWEKVTEAETEIDVGGETVLLVEDEEMLRSLARRVLVRAGYAVLVAENGVRALEVVREHSGPIDLIVTDVIMPELSGPAMVEQLRQDHSDLKVLYMSGYTGDSIEHHGIQDQKAHFLSKPFRPRDLETRIRLILDGQESSLRP